MKLKCVEISLCRQVTKKNKDPISANEVLEALQKKLPKGMNTESMISVWVSDQKWEWGCDEVASYSTRSAKAIYWG